jgi:hypothetical protein
MSVATLKKKTEAKYNLARVGDTDGLHLNRTHKSIGNDTVFSLNGTRRSQGYVGQDTLGRSLPRTLMRGNVIRGHGGCCGKYQVNPIVQSSVTSTNNPNVVKSSVKNTNGMIMTQYRWIRRGQPYTSVKPDSTMNNNTQQDYITRIARTTIQQVDSSNCVLDTKYQYAPSTNCNNILRKTTNYQNLISSTKKICNITKDLTNPPAKTSAIATSEGLYILKLSQNCVNNDINSFINPSNRTPLPGT